MPLVCHASWRQKRAYFHPLVPLTVLKKHLKFNELAQFMTLGTKLAQYSE
jgi:hypothetical protein